jgi:predicted esterase
LYGRIVLNNELKRALKEAPVTYFEVLPRYLSGGTQETLKDLIQYNQYYSETEIGHLLNATSITAWANFLGEFYYNTDFLRASVHT